MTGIKIKNLHKLWLEITMIGESKLKIKLLMISSCVPKQSYEKSISYNDRDTGLVIWSFQDFIFDERQLRIPQTNMLSNNMEHIHDFKSDNKRYTYLKKLHRTLNNWSKDVHVFPTNFTYGKQNCIRMEDKFWIIN
jgi:hypothetical protein